MHVARLEIDALWRQILTRMPNIESNGPVELTASNFIAGVHAMPVRFQRDRH
jgi:cytochrome P450